MLDTVGKCKRVVRACVKTWIITAWYNQPKNEGEGYRRQEKNAPTEQPDERKVCGTQRNLAEDRKEWQKLKNAGSHTPASQQITLRKRRYEYTIDLLLLPMTTGVQPNLSEYKYQLSPCYSLWTWCTAYLAFYYCRWIFWHFLLDYGVFVVYNCYWSCKI